MIQSQMIKSILRPRSPKLHIVYDFFGHNKGWYFWSKKISKNWEQKSPDFELTKKVKTTDNRKNKEKDIERSEKNVRENNG